MSRQLNSHGPMRVWAAAGAAAALSAAMAAASLLVVGPAEADASRQLNRLVAPNVEMPASDKLFPGPGADTINANCLTCHSQDHVMNQPSLTREGWHEVVEKMIHAYKAPINDADAATIVDYLERIKGRS